MRYSQALGSAMGLLLVAGTGADAQSNRNRDRERDREVGDTAFVWARRMSSGATLTIKNIIGDISVTAASGDRVEVRAEKRTRGTRGDPNDVSFDVDESSSGVMICTVYRGDSACDEGSFNNMRVSVRYVIALPRGLRLKASTGNGELSVERAGADIELTTGNGAIHVGETEGRVTATTGNGELEIESAKGPVRAHSGNGRILVSTSVGPVSAQTGNGDIDVRMRTLASDADMDFQSGSGTIRVTLPADFNGRVDASTGNGELRTDFEIKLTGRMDPQHLRGVIGSGGATLRLQTGNGRLEIRKGA